MLKRNIAVLGICDTGGMAASLQALLPDTTVSALWLPSISSEEQTVWLTEQLEKFDKFVVNAAVKPESFWQEFGQPEKIILYPHLHFSAFHPDMTYVSKYTDNQHNLIDTGYNSSIGIWSFINSLSPEDTIKLYRHDVFDALGYYSEWPGSVNKLADDFSRLGLQFRPFFLKVKREGAFMLSFNHPKIATIVALAKRVAIDRLGAPAAIAEQSVYINDGLAAHSWPVYPEIGEYYGLKTEYNFSVSGRSLDLPNYVHTIFAQYAPLDLKLGETFFGRDRDRMDMVLGSFRKDI